ncbi:Hydrolase acrC [Cladobotryum mycophilum]|uniref:Hydrolase acrC n=1 Tax=Cladobotryum mycophilum TaxID=491253 RepID=A0ABR0SX63_9HYPO
MANPNASMYQLNADASFHFEILRPMSLAVYDGGDLSEVLTAANSILPGDFESFYSAFASLANHVYDRAQSILKNKFPVSARSAFFSAATYFRMADFYLHGNPSDPRIMQLWTQQTDAFNQGLALLNTPNERFTIHTPDFDIPAIWFAPDEEVKKRPTIVLGNGYDGCQEEMYHVIGLAALERGYNVLSYEGPGQPSVRRYQNLGFIPDWERVVTPVIDHLLTNPSVDPDAIGLLGLSFGGYLAPRAAAFEHRLSAVMAIDGVWDFGVNARNTLGPDIMKIFDAGNKTEFDQLLLKLAEPGRPTGLRWSIQQGMWAFNTKSPYDFVSQLMNYTLKDVIQQVKVPVFVGLAQQDIFFPGQPELLAEHLGKLGHLYNFTDANYIGTHAGVGSLKQHSAIILDWFQNVLDSKH